MGKAWDASGVAYDVDLWREVLRVLKPGGHLAAFGGTRTYHRMACAIEDAGFEVRDSLHWLYGSGFPKSLDVGKAIDKAAGAEREVIGLGQYAGRGRTVGPGASSVERDGANGTPIKPGGQYAPDNVVTAPATPEAEQWQGWGTALKPSHEPIVLARRPLAGTIAANVLQHGTGGINVDGCRVESGSDYHSLRVTQGGKAGGGFDVGASDGTRRAVFTPAAGRWPSNVLFTHDPGCNGVCAEGCPVDELDQQSGPQKSSATGSAGGRGQGAATYAQDAYTLAMQRTERPAYGDQGGASRFFPVFRYCAKAPTKERPTIDGKGWPTVKPVALMRWLVRLICPPGGLVLDPFAGTGTTLHAAALEGMQSIGIERDELAHALAEQRLTGLAQQQLDEQHTAAAAVDTLPLFDVEAS